MNVRKSGSETNLIRPQLVHRTICPTRGLSLRVLILFSHPVCFLLQDNYAQDGLENGPISPSDR